MSKPISKQHLDKALFFGDEPAWKREDAELVLRSLRANSCAVLGIEVWRPSGKSPEVLGWNNYESLFAGDWNMFVDDTFEKAMLDIQKLEDGELVNLSWLDKSGFNSTELS